jgi:hypothetical protein
MEDEVRMLFSDARVEMLDSTMTIAKLELRKNEKLLMQMPSVFLPSSFNRAILISVVQIHT